MTDIFCFLIYTFNKPDTLIAFCALIVSICSIALTIITLRIQRNHARLSVKPLASIQLNNTLGQISIVINNSGLGPMIITSINTYRTDDPTQVFNWPDIIKGMSVDNSSISSKTVAKISNSPVINGQSITIFEHIFDETKPEHIKTATKIKNGFKDFTLKVKYSNIYGDSFEADHNLQLLKH